MKDDYLFPAIIAKEKKEKEYSVYFPDLDVATSGVDEKDALDSARELLGTVIYGLELDKMKIPAPSKLSDIKIGANEYVALVDVFMPAIRLDKNTRSVNRTVTLPAWLNSLAKSYNINFSKVLQEGLEKKLAMHIKMKLPGPN